jgi:hypothetical protein
MNGPLDNTSSVTSPSLSLRTMSKLNALDGSYQPKSTMWSGITKSVYPQSKMRAKQPGNALMVAKSMYNLLGFQYNKNQNVIEPFRKGGFRIPLKGDTSLYGSYNKRRRNGDYDWNVGVSVPIGR